MTDRLTESRFAPAFERLSLPFFAWNKRLSRDFFDSIHSLQKISLRTTPGFLCRRIRYFRYFAHRAFILYNKSTTLKDCFPLVTSLQGLTAEILAIVDESLFPPDQLPPCSIKEFRCTASFPVVFSWNSGYWRERATDQGINKKILYTQCS